MPTTILEPKGYSFFLFTKLFDAIINVDYEYDLMYDDLTKLYIVYHFSEHNSPNEDEYTCIVKFFRANKDSILKQEYLTLPIFNND